MTETSLAGLLAVLAGCGRIGFAPSHDGSLPNSGDHDLLITRCSSPGSTFDTPAPIAELGTPFDEVVGSLSTARRCTRTSIRT